MEFLKKYFLTILTDNKRKLHWRVLSMTLACVLVFVTTYSLILPAITMDADTAETMAGFDGVLLDDESDDISSSDFSYDDMIDDESDAVISEVGDDSFDFDSIFDDEEDSFETGTEFSADTDTDFFVDATETEETEENYSDGQMLAYAAGSENTSSSVQIKIVYGSGACIPQDARLVPYEIGKGTWLYEACENRAIDYLRDKGLAAGQGDNTYGYEAKFYQLNLTGDGEEVSPAETVEIEMTFETPLVGDDFRVIQFAQKNASDFSENVSGEPYEAEDACCGRTEDGRLYRVTFSADQLTVIGIVIGNKETAETEEIDVADTEKMTEAETDNNPEAANEEPAETEEITEAETEEITEAETEEITEAETEEIAETEIEEITEAETEEITEAETEDITEAAPEDVLPAQNFESATDNVAVRVYAPEGAFPEGTVMSVKDIDDSRTLHAIENETADDTKTVTKIHAVDISFTGPEANEIEPLIPIRVEMTPLEIPEADNTVVVHVDDRGRTETVETVDPGEVADLPVSEFLETEITGETGIEDSAEVKNEERGDEIPAPETVVFEVGSFSVYALVYTVDFHWEVNGRMFEFSIPGGGFVSFYNLLEVLNIVENDLDTEKDEIQELVDGVESIEFSDPELVSISRIEENTTVGAIKERLGLECEYSAELTEEQIEEINAQEAKAGDWALISLKAFDTEESLAVTMKNGDTWTVRVTDAQKPYKDVSQLENGTYIIYRSDNSNSRYMFLKNNGKTEIKYPANGQALNASDFPSYTWYVTKNGDGTYTIKSSNSNRYISLTEGKDTIDKWSKTSSQPINVNLSGTDGIAISHGDYVLKRNDNGFYYNTGTGVGLTFYKIENDPSSGTSHDTGIELTDEERAELSKWEETIEKFNTLTDYNKTAEVSDYDQRIYKIDIEADSGIMDFYKDVDLGFVLDVSNSMKFPSSLKALEDQQGDEFKLWMDETSLNAAYWAYQEYYNRQGCFYILSDPALTSTIYRVFWNGSKWQYQDASSNDSSKIYDINNGTTFKEPFRQTYTLYYADDQTPRIDYLNDSVAQAVATLKKIVQPTEGTDDETANVRIAYNFFAGTKTKTENGVTSITQYAIRGSNDFVDLRSQESRSFEVVPKGNEADGTRQDLALYDSNNDPNLGANEFSWHTAANVDRYVILVTDGAPNGASMADVEAAAGRLKTEDHVKLITIGLSTKDVDGGSTLLKTIADDVDGNGIKDFYEAEKASDLKHILLKILQSIMAKGLVRGKVTDTIDKGFYPVDAQGNPLSAGVYKNGSRVQNAQISDYVSGGKPTNAHANEAFYTWEQVGDEWKITWYNQEIGWNDNDSTTGNPWTGTVYVKAKEDYLGGNLIETNDGHAQIEPTGLKLVINGTPETNWRPLEGMTPIDLPVPRVNVHNLETKENSTTWTVYKGTSVTPKEQLEALWNAIPIEEVVSASQDNAHKITTGQSANVGTAGAGETFSLGSLMSEVAPEFNIDSLIDQITATKSSASADFTYTAYGHESGKITVKVERTIGNQTPATHTADTVGTPVEQYKVTFTYKPYTEAERMNGKVKDASDTDHNNGTNGRGAEETGEIRSENTHTINVYARTIEVEKLKPAANDSTVPLTDKTAAFSLYRKWKSSDGPANKVSLKGYTLGGTELGDPSSDSDYYFLVETKSTVNGVAKFTAELSSADAPYYLAETTVPDGYADNKVLQTVAVTPGPNITTTKTATPVTATEEGAVTTAMPYDWTQGVRVWFDNSETPAVYVNASGTQIVPTTGENARTYVLSADGDGFFKTSVLNEPLASLQLKKQVTINDFDPANSTVTDKTVADGTYVIHIAGKDGTATAGKSYTVRITIRNGAAASATVKDNTVSGATDTSVTLTNGVLEIPNMIPGEYTVTEDLDSKTVLSAINSTGDGAVADLDNRKITITLDGSAESVQLVTLTNNYADNSETDIAHVSVRKTFRGLKPGMKLPENFNVTAEVTATINGTQQVFNYTLAGVSNTSDGVIWNQSVNADGDVVWDWRIAIHGLTPSAQVKVTEVNYTKPGYDVTTSANPGGDGVTSYTGTVSSSTVVSGTAAVITEKNSLVFPLTDNGSTATIFVARIVPSQTSLVISKNKLNLSEKAALEEKLHSMPNAGDWYNGTVPLYYSFEDAANHKITVRNRSEVTYSETTPGVPTTGQIRFDKKCQWDMVATVTMTYVEGRPADFNFVNSYTERGVGIDIVKVDKDQRTKTLPGAEFTLTKLDESTTPDHIRYKMIPETTNYEKQVTSAPTGNDGKTSFDRNLTSGYYEIDETKLPAGYVSTGNEKFYIKIEDGIAKKLIVSDDPEKTITEWEIQEASGEDDLIQFTLGRADDQSTVDENETVNTSFSIGNTPGAALPNTGGPGTTLNYLLGVLLTALACTGLVMRKRRERN